MSAVLTSSSLSPQLSYSRYLALSTNSCFVCRCLSLTHSYTRNNNKTFFFLTTLEAAPCVPVQKAPSSPNMTLLRTQKRRSPLTSGPRNFRKLVQKGITGVAQLEQLYKDKFFGKSSDKLVEYLQSSVGIIHKNHAESITTFIKKSVDDDEEKFEDNSSSSVQKKRLTFYVEGYFWLEHFHRCIAGRHKHPHAYIRGLLEFQYHRCLSTQ